MKAARPRSEPEVSRGNTGIDSNCRRDGGGHPTIDSLTGTLQEPCPLYHKECNRN